jgi:hypothetical protein
MTFYYAHWKVFLKGFKYESDIIRLEFKRMALAPVERWELEWNRLLL